MHLRVALLLTITLCQTVAAELVFRNDFVCYDTTRFPETNFWPYIALDSAGNISQICGEEEYLGPNGPNYWRSYYEFNKYDKYGERTQPVDIFLPDSISDTTWEVHGALECYSNRMGRTVISTVSKIEGSYPRYHGMFLNIYESSGIRTREPVRLDYDLTFEDYILPMIGSAHINNDNMIANVWYADDTQVGSYSDSLYVRIYDYDADTLGPVIRPAFEPSLVPLERIRDIPKIGIFDDGSFIVSARAGRYLRVINFIIYNSDYTVKVPWTIAQCESDTSNCALEPQAYDMAVATDGDFYFAWNGSFSEPYCYNRHQVYVKAFNSDGSTKYGPFRVNDHDTLNLWWQRAWPNIACNDSGYVIVSWSDAREYPGCYEPAQTLTNVYVQKIDPDGNLVGPNYRANNALGDGGRFERYVFCDLNDAGQAVVMWRQKFPRYGSYAELIPYHDIGTFIPGDLNLDRQATVSDLTYFVDHLFGDTAYTFWPRDLIDINGDDNNGDITDLTYLISYLFLGGPAPFTPYEGIREETPHNSSSSAAVVDSVDYWPKGKNDLFID